MPAPGASVGDDRVVNTGKTWPPDIGGRRVLGVQAELAPTTPPGQWGGSVDPVRVHDIDEGGCAVRDVGVDGLGAVGLVKYG